MGLHMADDDLDDDSKITANDLLMQDLYKQMSIDPLDDEEQMRKKLRKKRQDANEMFVTFGSDEEADKLKQKAMDLLNKAEAILLNPQNRQEYDNALKKQTLSISDPNDPAQANQPPERNQYYLTPEHDLRDPMQTFEEFVDKNNGVINRVNEEISAEDKDKLENGELQFGMDASQQGAVKFGFPNEQSCNEFGKDLLKHNVITSMVPRPGASRKEEDEEKLQQDLQNKSQDQKEQKIKEEKIEDLSSSQAVQSGVSKMDSAGTKTPTPANEADESQNSPSKLTAIPTLKPPGGIS